MTDLRKTIIALLIARGYDQVLIRSNGNVRIRKNGVWADAGRVGDYADEIANARVSTDERARMHTGYGQLD